MEIATITGHSLINVRSIPDAPYLNRDSVMGDNAILKLERGTHPPDGAPEDPDLF